MGPATGRAVLPADASGQSVTQDPLDSLSAPGASPSGIDDGGTVDGAAELTTAQKWRKRIWSGLGWVAIGVALYFMWPTWLGGHMTLVQVAGTSMEPTFYTKDVLVTWRQDDYNIGDIIVYDPKIAEIPDANITHRVTKKLPNGTYITQGDNRDTADDFRPTAADIKGDVVLVLPTSKMPMATSANVWAVILCALIAAFCVFKIITIGGTDDEEEVEADVAAPAPTDDPASTSTQ